MTKLIKVGDAMDESNDDLSKLLKASLVGSDSTKKLIELRAHLREIENQILDFSHDPEFNQVSLQKLKNERSNLLDAIERIKDEMIPDLNA